MISWSAKSGRAAIEWGNLGSLAIVLIALIACASCSPTRASLQSEEAAKLQMPDSTELASGGHDEEQTPEGGLPAIAWREYGVDASWDEVFAYFGAELTAQGWEVGGGSSGIRSTSEYDAEAWHKGDRILRLGHLRDSPKPDAGSFMTWYRVSLIGQGAPTD